MVRTSRWISPPQIAQPRGQGRPRGRRRWPRRCGVCPTTRRETGRGPAMPKRPRRGQRRPRWARTRFFGPHRRPGRRPTRWRLRQRRDLIERGRNVAAHPRARPGLGGSPPRTRAPSTQSLLPRESPRPPKPSVPSWNPTESVRGRQSRQCGTAISFTGSKSRTATWPRPGHPTTAVRDYDRRPKHRSGGPACPPT